MAPPTSERSSAGPAYSPPPSSTHTSSTTHSAGFSFLRGLRSFSTKGYPTSAPSSPSLGSASLNSTDTHNSSTARERDRSVRPTGSSSRGAGVKPKRSPSPAVGPPTGSGSSSRSTSGQRRDVVAYGLAGTNGPTAYPAAPSVRGGLASHMTKAGPTVATSSTNMLSSEPIQPTNSHHSSVSPAPPAPITPPVPRTTNDAPKQETLTTPSQILPRLAQLAERASDPVELVPLIRILARSVTVFPFPPPTLAANDLADALANINKKNSTTSAHTRPSPTPLQIYLSQRHHLATSSPPPLRAATLELLLGCLEASQASTGGMKEYEKAQFWEEARRWAEEAPFEVDDGQGGTRWVLGGDDREALVAVLSSLTRGGRDLSDMPGLVALLCTFVTDALPVPRPPSPLFDPDLMTPFVRIVNAPPAPHASSLALLVNLHKFSAPSIYKRSTQDALRAVLEVAKLNEERELGGGPGVGVLDFLSAVVTYGEVAGVKQGKGDEDLQAKAEASETDKILKEVVSIVARIVGCEGLVGVEVIEPSGAKSMVASQLPPLALKLMTDLIRSPANQALKSLREGLVAPPGPGEERPPTPKLLLVGALRSLRKAFEVHSQMTAASGSRGDSGGGGGTGGERWPSLLSLGLPLVWTGLHRVMEWNSGRVDAEVLRLVEERIGAAAARARSADDLDGGVTFEEWDMAIDILERAKWHIKEWEDAKRKRWVMADFQEVDKAGELFDEDERPSEQPFIRRPDVLAMFSSLLQKLVNAWQAPHWTGPSERLFTLLIGLAGNLSDGQGLIVLEQCESNELCLPSHPDWLTRTEEVVRAFYLAPTKSTAANATRRGAAAQTRRRALQLLTSLHSHLRHIDSVRNDLVGSVVMPLLETSLEAETDVDVAEVLLSLVSEIGRDVLAEEEATLDPDGIGVETDRSGAGEASVFDRLRMLLSRVAKQPSRTYDRGASSVPVTPRQVPKGRVGLPSLSRYSSLRQSPSASQSMPSSPVMNQSEVATAEPIDVSYLAVLGLISLFHQCLARSTRSAAQKAVVIFRELLALLVPTKHTSDDGAFTAEPSIPLRTRLVILQWMVRFRADAGHRIHWQRDVDISSSAKVLGRAYQAATGSVHGSGHAPAPVIEEEDVRSRGRAPRSVVSSSTAEGRSRSTSRLRRGSGERSPSRGPALRRPLGTSNVVPQAHLWTFPEQVPFDFGVEAYSVGGRGLASFDHNQMRSWTEEVDPNTGETIVTPVASEAAASAGPPIVVLPVSEYLDDVHYILQHDQEWELVSYLLCHLPEQLSNKHFACGPRCADKVKELCKWLCLALKAPDKTQYTFPKSMPAGIRRAEIHAVAVGCLTALIAYKSLFVKTLQDAMVDAFKVGLNDPQHTAKPCLHALSIAAFEMRPSVTKHITNIIRELQRIISTSTLAVHILEFLAGVGQVPSLYANFTDSDYQTVFTIATKYIETHNNRLVDGGDSVGADGGEGEGDEESDEKARAAKIETAFSQYVYLLAYYTVETWFLALKLSERPKIMPFLTPRLVQVNEGRPEIDEPTEVCFDMMARYAYTNADPRARMTDFDKVIIKAKPGDRPTSKTWIVGTAAITIQSTSAPAWVEVIIRRPSGVVKMLWELQNIAGVCAASEIDYIDMYMRHRERYQVGQPGQVDAVDQALAEATAGASGEPKPVAEVQAGLVGEIAAVAETGRAPMPKLDSGVLSVDPSFFTLQLSSYPDFAQGAHPVLVTDAALLRMINGLDQIAVVDSHKVGVLYAGPGQKDEASILANTHGSKAYIEFVSKLGVLTLLKGSRAGGLYAGGLDQEHDTDGKWAYVWDDDISQMVFHVATLMPTDRARDPRCTLKKRHIGNDYVKIIYNDSGAEFAFDTLPGQFNFVNIVVEPHTPAGNPWIGPGMTNNAQFFKVAMQRQDGMPEIGPLGGGKVVAGDSLPEVVRQLALHANIFAQVYLDIVGFQDGRGQQQTVEYNSNWRRRLQQIKKVRNRVREGGGGGGGQGGGQGGGAVDLEVAEESRRFSEWLG